MKDSGKKKYNSKDSLAVKQLKAKIKITSNVTFGKLYDCLSITSFKIRLQLRKKILQYVTSILKGIGQVFQSQKLPRVSATN